MERIRARMTVFLVGKVFGEIRVELVRNFNARVRACVGRIKSLRTELLNSPSIFFV